MAASTRIPALIRDKISDRAKKTLDIVQKFVDEECIPADAVFEAQCAEGGRWTHPPIMDELKRKGSELGLWNMFLPKGHYNEGAGFTNVEYGLMCELFGKSRTASEATNNSAPDTGNMEVLAKYGTDAQKKDWLVPLMEGKIRSAYVMTEPQVASSDATNVQLSIKRDGDSYVLNGQKWWISGAGYPHCKLHVVMGKTDPNHPQKYKQQSIILVPADTPGITVKRPMKVMGFDDAPHGHMHLIYENVRVPASNIILGEGRGFEVMQGRMGPGRIHHAMRTIGAAELALEWLLARANDPRKKPFGKLISEQGTSLDWIARSRIEIDAARLIVLNAAAKIDDFGAKEALIEIAQAKVLTPNMALTVIDRAMQTYGGEGLSQDTPLAALWSHVRTVRIVDGPDAVHLMQLGRKENGKYKAVQELLQRQADKTEELFQKYSTPRTSDSKYRESYVRQAKL